MNTEPRPGDLDAREARQRRVRLAFLRGAEERARRATGRALTEDELRLIIARFPVAEASR